MSLKLVQLKELLRLEYGKGLTDTDRDINGSYGAYGANGIKARTDKFLYDKPSILIGRKGSVGELNLVNDKFWALDVAYYVTHDTSKTDLIYLYYALSNENLATYARGVKPGLNRNDVYEIKIYLPSLATQHKIVAKLEAIFAEIDIAIAAAEANANNAEALFQSYITQIFEDKKYEFKLVKFGSTANFVRGPFGGSLKKSIFVEKGYAVYEQQHAIDNQFTDIRYYIDNDKFEEMKRFELRSGDLIMSCSGTMGKIAIVPENIQQGVINQALLKITPNTNVYGNYIARLLSSKFFQDTLSKLSGGAAIQNVPAVSILKDILIPLPNSNNQKLIIDVIGVLESNKNIIKNSYARKSTELKALKKSILQKAFSGELVKD